VGWGALLAGIVAALGAMGRGPLSTPPVTGGLGAVRSWASTRDAPTILMTGMRVGGRLIALYLLASATLATLARVTRRAAAVRLADAISLPPIRRLATGAAGLLVVAGPIAAPAATGLGGRPRSAPVLVATTAGPATRGPAGPGHFDAGAWPSLGLLDSPGLPSPALGLLPSPVPPSAALPMPAVGATSGLWTVRPGDSLWVIAESTLRAAWGRQPTDPETGRFWVVVVAVNVARLDDPSNANLLFPGQEMMVPPPPSAPIA